MIEKEQKEGVVSSYYLDHWQPTDTAAIYELEKACWAPWLRKPEQQIATIAENFPEAQLLLRNRRESIVATMSANRVNWDGNPASLTTWDAVAGGSIATSDYVATYTPDGNTLCLISSAIDPTVQGERLASQLVREMGNQAKKLGATHLIGPFRPSGYGDFKLEHGPVAFAQYCAMTREDGLPIDPWLRSASRLGMQPLRIEEQSMVVEVPIDTFAEYQRTYHPQKWQEIAAGVWECGETGSWFVNGDRAVYIEPNLWGELPI